MRVFLFVLSFLAVFPVAADEPFPMERLGEGGYVVLMRHALAPGTGDPSNFQLDDCSTQRNLDARGREQSRRIGDAFRAVGIDEAAVYSSQWCRCLETAALMELGEVRQEPALNSFFSRRSEEQMRIDALRDLFARLPVDGPPVVMVTHQVTVTAISDDFVISGEARVLKLDGTRNPKIVGSVRFD